MTTVSPALLLEAVVDVARCAGDVALAHYRSNLVVEIKADGSPVTVADREAERAARDWIGRRFANDAVIGEELGSSAGSGHRRWIIDPIDGTKSFVRGVPLWGTLVAVCEGETVLAGAAFFPAIGEMIAAATGEGTWLDGRRVRVSDEARLGHATALTTDDRFPMTPEKASGWRLLSANVGLTRTWGDCYGYLLVASGRAEIMVDPILSEWDAAAVFPIVTEAGGVFTDYDGRPSPFGGSAIATNAALARPARECLTERRTA
jgi:histidinol phosphatase-like enzyme (inositol monophosphatase family)